MYYLFVSVDISFYSKLACLLKHVSLIENSEITKGLNRHSILSESAVLCIPYLMPMV